MKMKKVLFALLFVFSAISAHAQFEKETVYVNTSLSNMSMQFNKDFKLGLEAKVGYFFTDDWAVLGYGGVDYRNSSLNYLYAGAGIRYYIEQNGLFLGAGLKYAHQGSYNDMLPNMELGYTFFLSKTVTIEPSLFYDQSLKNHGDYSTLGFKLGFGFYF